MADLDLQCLRLDASRLNGGGPRSEREASLQSRAEAVRDRERRVSREESRLRAQWTLLRCAVILFGLAALMAMAFAPVFLRFADWVWRG
jgi:hypothetical protein